MISAPIQRGERRIGRSVQTLGTGRFTRIFHRNLARYVARHLGRGALALLTPCWIAGLLARAAVAGLGGHGTDARELCLAAGDRLRRVDAAAS